MWSLRILGVVALFGAFENTNLLFITLFCFLLSWALHREIEEADNQRRVN